MPAIVHSAATSFAASPVAKTMPVKQKSPRFPVFPWSILIALIAFLAGSHFQPSFGGWLVGISGRMRWVRFGQGIWSSHPGVAVNDTLLSQGVSEIPQATWNPAFDRSDDDIETENIQCECEATTNEHCLQAAGTVTGDLVEEHGEIGMSSVNSERYHWSEEEDTTGATDEHSETSDEEPDEEPELWIHTAKPTQPLAVVQDDFLRPRAFQALKACVANHPWIGANELNEDGFGDTKGLLMRWNARGVQTLRSYPELKCMSDWFDRVRHLESNAYVMNILVCDQPNGDPQGNAVGIHVDNSVSIRNHTHSFSAHEVDVLYIQVPDDMEGGQLQLFLDDGEDSDAPSMVVAPRENRFVRFRGDASHLVKGYRTMTGVRRISLVLEQYYLSRESFQQSVPWECERCGPLKRRPEVRR